MPELIQVYDLFRMFSGTHCYWHNTYLTFVFQYKDSEIHLHSTASISPLPYYDENGNDLDEYPRDIENEIYGLLKDCAMLKAMDFLIDSDKYYIVCNLYRVDEKIWKRILKLANENQCKYKLRRK